VSRLAIPTQLGNQQESLIELVQRHRVKRILLTENEAVIKDAIRYFPERGCFNIDDPRGSLHDKDVQVTIGDFDSTSEAMNAMVNFLWIYSVRFFCRAD